MTEPRLPLAIYNRTAGAILCRRNAPRCIALAAVIPLALSIGGCSYKLDSVFSRDGEKSATAGSLAAPGRAAAPTADADLAFAKAAAADALARTGDISVPWENPGTGARGTVTPLASSYTQDGFVCRDFLASYIRKDAESWLQGDGCRIHQGRWEVRHMRALQRP
jgi:surface antigen